MVKVMGIINVDDDSFYSASRALTEKEILSRLETLVGEGADIGFHVDWHEPGDDEQHTVELRVA